VVLGSTLMQAVDWLEDPEENCMNYQDPTKQPAIKKWNEILQHNKKGSDNNSLQIYREQLQRGQEQAVLCGQRRGQKVAATSIRLNIRKALNNFTSKHWSRLPGEMVRASIIRGVSINETNP